MALDVLSFGAIAGSGQLMHQPIQRAIDAARDRGGGMVNIPAGRYRCGTLRLWSNVHLHLEAGAVIEASQDAADYPDLAGGAGDVQKQKGHALLVAREAGNITLSGQGTIDGMGREALKHPEAGRIFRPAMVWFDRVHDLRIEGVRFENPSQWTIHLIRCRDVVVRGITILANRGRINTDGIDPDGCSNVIISDCVIRTCDDCICLKSTQGDACENITVANCLLSSACAALKLGTEGVGDIRNIAFSNCVITNTNVALAMYNKDGGNYENVVFSNMIVESANQFPIMLDVTPRFYREPHPGRIRHVRFDNLVVTSPGRIHIEGVPGHEIEDVSFSGISWRVSGPLRTTDMVKPPGARRTEHDPHRPNYAVHPYQVICARARDVRFHDFRLYVAEGTDPAAVGRGLFFLQHTRGFTAASLGRLQVPGMPEDSINASQNVRIQTPA